MTNVTSIGSDFLFYCTGLTTLKMGSIIPPVLGDNPFKISNNLSLIQVPCGSENAYKTANN